MRWFVKRMSERTMYVYVDQSWRDQPSAGVNCGQTTGQARHLLDGHDLARFDYNGGCILS
jgi:hypothetical protein